MLWNYLKLKMSDHLTSVIEEDHRSMTYAEAILKAEQLSKKLTGTCYAILCKSEMNTALALLACLAAGKPAIPLSNRYGEAHIEKLLRKITPEHLLTDDFGDLAAVKIGIPVKFEVSAALILCTSGTSGTPKGVMLSEENIRANVTDIRTYFELTESDRILIARPLYHVAAFTGEFLLALITGANIVFDCENLNPTHLIEQLISKQITVFCGTPTLLSLTARLLKCQGNRLAIRQIGVSGECLTETAVKTISKGFPNAQIYPGYGLTEASPRVAYLPSNLLATHPTCAGFFLPSVEGKIVNEDGQNIQDGETGELLVKGPNVMIGYYKDQSTTDKALTDGWLHTGDLAYMKEGLLYIKGRKDDLIIYAGMNIYPAEIEQALRKDCRVQEVLAYGIPDKLCGQTVGLKIAGDFSTKAEIVDLCNRTLPPYARPKIIEWVESLPKNGSGKILRSRTDTTK